MTEEDVVGRLRSGMTIGIGGWGRGASRCPWSGDPAIRPDDLTVVSYGGPTWPAVRGGQGRELVFGFVSLDSIPLDPLFAPPASRAGSRSPEFDEAWCSSACTRGARLPFLPTRAGLGSLVVDTNPGCARSSTHTRARNSSRCRP